MVTIKTLKTRTTKYNKFTYTYRRENKLCQKCGSSKLATLTMCQKCRVKQNKLCKDARRTAIDRKWKNLE